MGLAMIGIGIIAPFGMSPYLIYVLSLTFIYLILGLSFDLLGGHLGYFSLAHHALFAIGAYASSLFMLRIFDSFWLALVFATIFTSFASLFIIFPSFKLRGHYFALATIAIGEVIIIIITNWVPLTGGPFGILGIPRPNIMGLTLDSRLTYYYLVFGMTLMVIIFLHLLVTSRYGLCIHAIRENEVWAETMGLDLRKYKILTGMISGAIAGIAGSLFAHIQGVIMPESFHGIVLINVIIITIIGGLGHILGPIIGSFLVIPILEILRVALGVRYIIFGILLIVFMLLAPKGIVVSIFYHIRRYVKI